MSTRSISIGIMTSGWVLAIACSSVLGQWAQAGSTTEQSSVAAQRAPQGNWAPRFTTPGAPPATLATRPADSTVDSTRVFSHSKERSRAIPASYQTVVEGQDYDPLADEVGQLEPVPAGEPIPPSQMSSGGRPGCKNCNKQGVGEQFAAEYDDESYGDDGDFDGEGAPCGVCGQPCGGCCCICFPPVLSKLLQAISQRDVVVFAGAHGFKGPADLGRNGNFGFQEGVNFGAPLGDPWGLGYQLGFNAVQSDFAGSDPTHRGSRNQAFVTAGIFKRATAGAQWGVVFDLQRDQYNGWTDLKQVRSESGWVFQNGTEIGYFGAYRAGGDKLPSGLGLQPTDMFAVFLRQYFQNGGEGRIWGGATGMGDGLVGADFRVPLGGSFALENRFNYLLPKQGNANGGIGRESWGLVMQVTWYPGKKAACMNQREYLPLLNVADNATFMQQLQNR